MPIWCASHLKNNPPEWVRATQFRESQHFCKECLYEKYPETRPAKTLAQMAKEAFGKPAPIEQAAPAKLLEVEFTEEKAMPARKEIDWAKVQKDRDDGMTTTALAEKYGCSTPTICTRTKPASEAVRQARRKPAGKLTEAAAAATTSSDSPLASVIADLIAKRDKLNAAIEQLQAIEL
jgi:hypothetical protein